MGTLDEAIRQHLELKRRHGAAEDEVSRQEQEALGPVRSDAVPAPLPVPEPVPEPAVEADAPELEPVGESDGAIAASLVEPDLPDVVEPAPVAPAPVGGDDWLGDDSLDPFAPGVSDPEPEVAAPIEPQPAAREPEAPASPGAPGDEDVLEETPDFLQETPDHDRLWFEQRPPKDFDFDK